MRVLSRAWILGFAATAGALLGCDLEHDIGATATTGETGGSGDSSADSEDADSDSGVDSTTTTTTGDSDSDSDSDPDSGEETGGSGDTVTCEPFGDAPVVLIPPGFPSDLAGQRVVLQGPCTVTGIGLTEDGTAPVNFDCEFDAVIVDGNPSPPGIYETSISILFEDDEGLPFTEGAEVFTQWAAFRWFGESQWLRMNELVDPGRLMLELTQARAFDPADEDPQLGADVAAMFDTWPELITYASSPSECTTPVDDPCGGDRLRVTASSEDDEAVLELGQSGPLQLSNGTVAVAVRSAIDYPEPGVCIDQPDRWFDVTTTATMP